MQNQEIADWERRFTDYLREHSGQEDGSHDLAHFQRVWKSAQYINREEGMIADSQVLLASAYFHDLVSLPKDHPDRGASSKLSADRTVGLLEGYFKGFPPEKIE